MWEGGDWWRMQRKRRPRRQRRSGWRGRRKQRPGWRGRRKQRPGWWGRRKQRPGWLGRRKQRPGWRGRRKRRMRLSRGNRRKRWEWWALCRTSRPRRLLWTWQGRCWTRELRRLQHGRRWVEAWTPAAASGILLLPRRLHRRRGRLRFWLTSPPGPGAHQGSGDATRRREGHPGESGPGPWTARPGEGSGVGRRPNGRLQRVGRRLARPRRLGWGAVRQADRTLKHVSSQLSRYAVVASIEVRRL